MVLARVCTCVLAVDKVTLSALFAIAKQRRKKKPKSREGWQIKLPIARQSHHQDPKAAALDHALDIGRYPPA